MTARAWIFVTCLMVMAYQSHFSPTFFLHMVKASLADIQSGIDTALVSTVDHGDGDQQQIAESDPHQGWTTTVERNDQAGWTAAMMQVKE